MDSILFLAKKIITFFFSPLGIFLLFIVLGVLLRRRMRRLAKVCIVLGVVILFLLSTPLVAQLITHPLELCYYQYTSAQQLESKGIKSIVVLGAGVRQTQHSLFDQIGSHGLSRMLTGVGLYQEMPGATLYLSGGGFDLDGQEAGAMAMLAYELGVPKEDIVVEDVSWDTADQARLLAPVLKDQPFALVTSAWHMPRSMFLFKEQGLNPYPCPTDFQSRGISFSWENLLPSAKGLRLSEMAIKEYLGLLWAYL